MTEEPSLDPPARPTHPLLMDPTRGRTSAFAPPAAPTTGPSPGPTAGRAGPPAADPLFTPSVLAAPSVPAAAPAAFGPVSQVVRISVRTLTTRLDLVLPDRCTVAETLETVLQLSPSAVREQAIAHGGWALRGPDGRALPASSTLLDLGVLDGATLLLLGVDSATAPPVYDDVADAVADTVAGDPSVWSRPAGRAAAFGAAALFAAVALLPLLAAGPPWGAVALILAGVTAVALGAAGVLARRVGDSGAALLAGLVSVATATAAAAVSTAGSARLPEIGPAQLLLGAVGAAVSAACAMAVIGARRVPMIGIVTAAMVVGIGLGAALLFALPPPGAAVVTVGICLGLLPVVPSAALRLVRFGVPALPITADDVSPDSVRSAESADSAETATVDAAAVAERTRLAVGTVTALVQGLSWPALAAATLLAATGDPAAQLLAGVTGAALVLRSRLFLTIGQRLPLILAGVGALVAVLAGRAGSAGGPWVLLWVSLPAATAAVVCVALAMRRGRASPVTRRIGEIADVLLAVAMIPLVAAVLGLFDLVRGLGG